MKFIVTSTHNPKVYSRLEKLGFDRKNIGISFIAWMNRVPEDAREGELIFSHPDKEGKQKSVIIRYEIEPERLIIYV